MIAALLPTYWLEGLLALGFVLLLALPFIWLRGKMEEYYQRAVASRIKLVEDISLEFEQIRRVFWTEMELEGERRLAVSKDYSDLKTRLDLLDKSSNDRIEGLNRILMGHTKLIALLESSNYALAHKVKKLFDKKTLPKKSIPTKSIAGSKLKKANGARHAIR